MTTTETAMGRGVITMSRGLFRELFPDLLINDSPAQDAFDRVHRTLLLPNTYVIIAIFYASLMADYYSPAEWLIVVGSPSIPPVDENEQLPRVTPVYQRHADGTNSLTHIEIEHIHPYQRG